MNSGTVVLSTLLAQRCRRRRRAHAGALSTIPRPRDARAAVRRRPTVCRNRWGGHVRTGEGGHALGLFCTPKHRADSTKKVKKRSRDSVEEPYGADAAGA